MVLTVLAACVVQPSAAQNCTHTRLSKQFNFRTYVKRGISDNGFDEAAVTVIVTDKATKKETQRINFKTERVFAEAFTNCTAVQSYATGFNTQRDNADSDYGDLVVADLNFDGREDLAIKTQEGSNSGSWYAYYLQDSTGKFRRNKYLSDEMGFFPAEMNKKKRTLTIVIHLNVAAFGEITYKLDTTTQKWCKISSKTIPVE